MATPSNNRNRKARTTGGKGGGRAGKPDKPVAGTKDKTVRVPKEWNAKVVDPTNNRGGDQRATGGRAGGRAGKPSGSIARPAAKPPVKPSAGVTANYQMLTNPTQNRGAGQRVTGGQAGGRAGKPSGDIARPAAKPTAATTAAAKSKLLGKGAVGTAIVGSILNAPEEIRKGVRLAKDPKGAVSDVLKGLGFTEGFLSKFNKKGGTSKEDKRSNRPGGGSKPKKLARPASDYEKLFQTGGSRANYGLDKAPPAPELPAAINRSSSNNNSNTPSKNNSTKNKNNSSSSSASTTSTSGTPAKPGQKWSDFNPGRGTSKTNNPLMKDMIKRMKDREDKEQASKAQQLTDKFRQNSGYTSAEKVDGSKYADELKKKKGYNSSVSQRPQLRHPSNY
jgi:hypothetical protein